MKSIFQDESLFKEFEENGFIIVDLLNTADIEQLKNIYSQYSIQTSTHFYSTSFLQDKQSRNEISNALQNVIRPKINLIFQSYKELGAVFLIKPSGENTQMPIHQDWTVADEPEHHSITVWIPLTGTTSSNGAITVLPKSHQLSTGLRSPSLQDPLQDIKEIAGTMMQTLEMKAGQAFIFTHALLHASHPNISGENRIAVAYGAIHEKTDLIYFHKSSADSKVRKLSIPEDFFISYPEPGKQPANSTLLEEFDYQEHKVSIEDFKKFYGLNRASFCSKIFRSFYPLNK